jgi:hypothetical protein
MSEEKNPAVLILTEKVEVLVYELRKSRLIQGKRCGLLIKKMSQP